MSLDPFGVRMWCPHCGSEFSRDSRGNFHCSKQECGVGYLKAREGIIATPSLEGVTLSEGHNDSE